MTTKLKQRREKVKKINPILGRLYPDAGVLLDYDNPFELLCATILAAQCTDAKVNEVTPGLFKKFGTPKKLAEADRSEVEHLVRPTGTYRQKAKSLQAMAAELVDKHDGEVPDELDALTDLRGVGRKTANVVLGACFGKQAVIVDTHVKRVTGRIGLTDESNPEKIEQDLMELVPEDNWTAFSHQVGFHGRQVCTSRKPSCDDCSISKWCDYFAETG